MTYFTEIDWDAQHGGRIAQIIPGSLAAEIGLQPGDQLLAINNQKLDDVIDVQFYAAEENLDLFIRRNNDYLQFETVRDYNQLLGLEFEHPTFDTDIRRCNNLCEFCFVLQMAPRFRRTLYIKDDDYRYSFLFGHYVTLTNLSDHDWWKIETMGLSPLYVSVHVTDLEMRRRFLRNPAAPDILQQLERLAEIGVETHAQLVIVPGFNDGQWLQKSIEDLSHLWPDVRSISVVPVGLTKHHRYGMRVHTAAEASSMIDFLQPVRKRFYEAIDVGFVYLTDEWYLISDREVPPHEDYDELQLQENGLGMVRDFMDEWQALKSEIEQWQRKKTGHNHPRRDLQFDSLTLITGTLFANQLQKTGNEFSKLTGTRINVIAIENIRLGKTITVAGLLMAEDILDQLKQAELAQLILFPRIIFDHPDLISLDDRTPQEIANRLSRPIALGDQMGDVWDALTGRSKTIFQPANT
ncbi:MAG: DUF512 domain-containing protein [Chloroflexota bacterium]|jgi:putative radical SAM enzyme (TIGR03279 family)